VGPDPALVQGEPSLWAHRSAAQKRAGAAESTRGGRRKAVLGPHRQKRVAARALPLPRCLPRWHPSRLPLPSLNPRSRLAWRALTWHRHPGAPMGRPLPARVLPNGAALPERLFPPRAHQQAWGSGRPRAACLELMRPGGKQAKELKKGPPLQPCPQPPRPGHTGRLAAAPGGAQQSATGGRPDPVPGGAPKGPPKVTQPQPQRSSGSPGHASPPSGSATKQGAPPQRAPEQQGPTQGSAEHGASKGEAPAQKKQAVNGGGQRQPGSQPAHPPGSPGYTIRPGMASAPAQGAPGSPLKAKKPRKGPQALAPPLPTSRQLSLNWSRLVSEDQATPSSKGSPASAPPSREQPRR